MRKLNGPTRNLSACYCKVVRIQLTNNEMSRVPVEEPSRASEADAAPSLLHYNFRPAWLSPWTFCGSQLLVICRLLIGAS